MTATPDNKAPGVRRFQRRPDKSARGRSAGRGAPAASAPDESLIFGLHAAEAALANPARRIKSAQATENAARKLEAAFAAKGLAPEKTTPRSLDKRLGADTVHQGVVLEVDPLPEPSLEDLAEAAAAGQPLILLDQVTDPHNVGAILRSGAVFGCAGLIMTRRHSPPLSGVLAKSASGGLEHVPVHLAQNLSRTIAALKDAGLQVIGLEGTSETALHTALPSVKAAIAIVLGAEGKGLRQLTAESCSRLCRIETRGALASLNVSNAAAIALHLIAIRSG